MSTAHLLSLRCFSEGARSWKAEAKGATDTHASVMNTKANFVYEVCNVQYDFDVVTYLSDELAVSHRVLKLNGSGVLETFNGLEAMYNFSKTWRSKVPIVLVRTEQAQHVDDALCKNLSPNMAPENLLIGPVVLHPREVLWEGQDVGDVVEAEVNPDDDGNSVMATPPVIITAPAIASMLPSSDGEREFNVLHDAPSGGASSVAIPVSVPGTADVPVVTTTPTLAAGAATPSNAVTAVTADAVAPAARRVGAVSTVRDAVTRITELGTLSVNLGARVVG